MYLLGTPSICHLIFIFFNYFLFLLQKVLTKPKSIRKVRIYNIHWYTIDCKFEMNIKNCISLSLIYFNTSIFIFSFGYYLLLDLKLYSLKMYTKIYKIIHIHIQTYHYHPKCSHKAWHQEGKDILYNKKSTNKYIYIYIYTHIS